MQGFVCVLNIRDAAVRDGEEIAALWRDCGLVVSYNDPAADLRFALEGACSTVLVATQEQGRIIGSVMAGHDGHRGWLYYVATAPDCRGQGVGQQMVKAGEDWLRARGVRKVQLLVRKSNQQVLSFYERLGFAEASVVMMSRWLTEPEIAS